MRAVIIDDEAPARSALRGLLRAFPEIELVGEADTRATAEALLGSPNYDLVFLDVHLRGCTGFDLVPFVRPGVQVIFVTGSDQHAVRAFEVNALDYVLKPIRPDRLAAAVKRLGSLAPSQEERVAPPVLAADDFVYVKTGTGTSRFLALAEVVAVVSDQNYSHVYLADSERLQVRRTMKEWEEVLPAATFVRVHRTTIINVARYRGSDRQSYELTLLRMDGLQEPVKASHRFLPDLRDRLAALGHTL